MTPSEPREPRIHEGTLEEQLARCDREIDAILSRPDVLDGETPAWLVTLGIEDWEEEKRLLKARAGQ